MTTFGRFGDTEAKLADTDFFNWFQLKRVDEPAGAGETIFRPGGEAFHALVSLASRTDAGGRLTHLSLKVARGFIDDPRQGAFARDIVKSFLETVAQGAATPLVDEIFFRAPAAPMITRGPAPPLPEQPSPGFLVFAGGEGEWSMDLPRATLTLANLGDALVMRAEARPGSKGWLSRLLGRG